jgi:TRAP-type C4-dicarboxylate transport system substrate-binding protein
MKRRSFLKSTLTASTAAALGAPHLSGLAQQSVTLKFHTFMAPMSNVWLLMHKPWMDKVEKESGGRIKFEGYPAMQLGGTPVQLYDQARDGVVDIVWTLPGNTAGRFPRIEVFELPFMMNNAESTSKAFWEYFQTQCPDEFKETQVLALHVHGPGMFHTVAKAIKTPADLKGLKMRGPTRQATNLLRSLGATPVGMPLPQIPDALSKGTIEGCAIPWEVVPSVKVHELTKFHSEFPAGTPGALHHDIRDGHEQGQVRQPGAGPEEGHRRQFRHGHQCLAGQGAAVQRRHRPQERGGPQQHHPHLHAGRSAGVHQTLQPDRRRLGGRHGQARLQGQGLAGQCQGADRQARLRFGRIGGLGRGRSVQHHRRRVGLRPCKSGSARNRDALEKFLAPLEVLPLESKAMYAYGTLRAQLQARGQPIGALDTLIAAHALAVGATLVTNKLAEFDRVPGLVCENWV